ncbi:MAG: division plane positioning ATPase MipZ [Caulobacter sp.]
MDRPFWRRHADIGLKARRPAARVIVLANEKGGAGKSTLAALIATAMLYRGRRVAIIDTDLRQQSLSRFFANRRHWLPAAGVEAPVPLEYKLAEDTAALAMADPAEAVSRFEEAISLAMSDAELVVVDTPGADTPVSRSAHLQADMIVTPMNDSFVDFDMLGQIDPMTLELLRPSLYTRVVQEARATRARHERETDWVVLRNRLAPTEVRNRERLTQVMEALSAQAGFRIGPGLRDRVAYREMFPFGLTIADLSANVRNAQVSSPRAAAREELQELLVALNLAEADQAPADGAYARAQEAEPQPHL